MPTQIMGLSTAVPLLGGSGIGGTAELIANINTTPVGTIANVAETDLMTYTLPANTLNANNVGVRITAWGDMLVGANNQTIKFYFGSYSTGFIGAAAYGSTNWKIVAEVVRTSSGNQTSVAQLISTASVISIIEAAPTQTDTAAIVIKCTGQNGVATVNGVRQLGMVVEVINLPGGGAVPNLYLPASLNQSTGTQALVPMGTSGSTSVVPGVANVNVTPVGTVADVAETNLMTYSLPANALSSNGKGVRVTAWGTTLVGANNQTIKFYFGSAAMSQLGPAAFGNGFWYYVANIIRTSSGNQVTALFVDSTATGAVFAPSTTAQTDTSAIVIKCTGQNGVATVNGVQQLGMIVEFIN